MLSPIPKTCHHFAKNKLHIMVRIKAPEEERQEELLDYVNNTGTGQCSLLRFSPRDAILYMYIETYNDVTSFLLAPGRVTMLQANPTADATQIHVTWQNPIANNCPVSKYKVEYQLTNR